MCFWHSPFDAGPSVLATTPDQLFRTWQVWLVDRNIRFGPPAGRSYASPAHDTTNLPPEQAPPDEIAGFRRLVFTV